VSAWKRIDAWLERKAPGVLASLNPGADPDAIAAFEKTLGRKLPESIRDAYAAHDGAIDEMAIAFFGAVRAKPQHQWLRMMSWLPLARVLEQLAFVKTLGEEWPEAHLPIALDAGGNLLLLDLDSEAILLWDHETWDPEEVAKSFGAWMTMLADDMDAKLVTTSEEEEEDETTLQLLETPVPSVVAPSVGPDRAARVLLAALVERKWIEVSDTDLEPLIKELHAALSVMPPKARGRAVSNVLERSKSVDEMFADDEQIADLVEEIG
jgi:cell wall assembly regulator SMI1